MNARRLLFLGLLLAAPILVRGADPPAASPRDSIEVQESLAKKSAGQGDFSQGAVHYQAAIEILEGLPPEQLAMHRATRERCMHNLVVLLLQIEDYRSAQEYAERILAIEGPSSTTLDQLGVACRERGDFVAAISYFHRAVAECEKKYPAEANPRGHPDILAALNQLAGVQRLQGRYADARATIEKSLQRCATYYQSESLQPAHELWVEAQLLRAAILFGEKKYDQARDEFVKGRNAFEAEKKAVGPKRYWATQRLKNCLAEQFRFFDDSKEFPKSAKENFPHGWPDLPGVLELIVFRQVSLGKWEDAVAVQRRQLDFLREYFPLESFPLGHARISKSMARLAELEGVQGNIQDARRHLEEALAIANRCASGQEAHAEALERLARHLILDGDPEPAKRHLNLALAFRRKLASPDDPYTGHLKVAENLNQLADLHSLDDPQAALAEYEAAEKIWKAAKPEAEAQTKRNNQRAKPGDIAIHSPAIEVDTIAARVHLAHGKTLIQQGQIDLGCAHLAACAQIRLDLYPRRIFPQGHPDLARALHELGLGFLRFGKLDLAIEAFESAEKLWLAQYPAEKVPQGNIEMAATLEQLAAARLVKGTKEGSLAMLLRAAQMRRTYADQVLPSLSEAEALNFCAVHLTPPHELLSWPAEQGLSVADLYHHVWFRRGQVRRTLSSRRQLLFNNRSPQLASAFAQYQAIRSSLSTALLATSAGDASGRLEALRELTAQKESLERQLATNVPMFRERLLEPPTAAMLAAQLPADAAFVDLIRYRRFDSLAPIKEWNDRWQTHYVAFVITSRKEVERIDLGPAGPIDQAVRAWREEIRRVASGKADRAVRDLLWAKIESRLPAAVQAVYLAPDGALSGIPWGAIPGDKPKSVVLDRCGIATVPSGQFLLEKWSERPASDSQESILAVGALDYDSTLAAPHVPLAVAGSRRIPTKGEELIRWQALPGTSKEIAALATLAGKRPVTTISRREATLAGVLGQLDQVTTAHFATHGFFADPQFRSALQLEEGAFAPSLGQGVRVSAAGRNPLALSGLVLSGANSANSAAGRETDDRSLLTGESIAGLDLPRLNLVVLSACDTGLGDVAGGEGLLGLQRAFQLAGAKNVVASLWKVDDAATQVLMTEFYANLWREKLPPIEALRRAQLKMFAAYRPSEGKLRAGLQSQPFDPAALAAMRAKLQAGEANLPPFYWAAFVLSGTGK